MTETQTLAHYETVIGLEVHVQLKTASKLFCACPADFGAAPNANICPVCSGQPGVLPVLNRAALEGIVRVGLALGCEIDRGAFFARKQYFYPDLPKAYQISQSDRPVCRDGVVEILTGKGPKTVRVQRIHLEEDAGKLLHAIGAVELPHSLVDLNRSGIPLIEIVSHPDLSSPEEAYAYLTALKTTVQYVGVSDCDMEKGSLRCDANVSVRKAGETALGTKVEIKNMNSFRAVKDAIAFEVDRQVAAVESGERIVQETRLWSEARGLTLPMRSKEEAHDYRYFPEPDLVPLALEEAWLEEQRRALPELPGARFGRLVERWTLSAYDAGVLVGQKELADYFEAALSAVPETERASAAKPLVNWITTELLGRLHADKRDVREAPVSPAALGELVGLIQSGRISGKMAKEVFAEAYTTGVSPTEIVGKKGLSQVSGEDELTALVDAVLAENPSVVADVQSGKARAIGFLVGALMKKTKGRANPQVANDLLNKRIGEMS